jgi:hypothetical protein
VQSYLPIGSEGSSAKLFSGGCGNVSVKEGFGKATLQVDLLGVSGVIGNCLFAKMAKILLLL